MAGQRLQNPAFVRQNGSWEQSKNTEKIMDELEGYNPDIELRPYNSVEAMGGEPMWGSGGGHYNFAENPNVIYVDPVAGDTHVVAHEGGHAVASSDFNAFTGRGRFGDVEKSDQWIHSSNPHHPYNAPERSGARVRAAHEMFTKPTMIEEASAQGFAMGLQQKLDIPYTNTAYKHPYDYPHSFGNRTQPMYEFNETQGSELNQSEKEEFERLRRSAIPAIDREYKLGFQRAMQGPR